MAQSQSSVGIKPTGDYIALNTTMNFNISVDSGDVEYYLVRMNDDIYKNTTESQLNVTFMQVSSNTGCIHNFGLNKKIFADRFL